MKKGLPTATVSILALTLAGTASAKEPYPGFDRDMALAFENDGKPMELALLSEQEMRETEGAVWPILTIFTHWAARLVAGASYGLVKSGVDEQQNMYASPIPHWDAANMVYWGFAGVIAKHGPVAAGVAIADELAPDWGVRRIHRALLTITRSGAYQSLGDFFRQVGGAIDSYSASLYGDAPPPSGTSAQPSSSTAMSYASSAPSSSPSRPSASSTSSRGGPSGADLVQLLPQDALRNFLAGLPTRTMNAYLRGIDPDISRTDFLDNLPPETVNKLILALTESDMRNFVRIIPASIMQPVFNASRHTEAFWRRHWRT